MLTFRSIGLYMCGAYEVLSPAPDLDRDEWKELIDQKIYYRGASRSSKLKAFGRHFSFLCRYLSRFVTLNFRFRRLVEEGIASRENIEHFVKTHNYAPEEVRADIQALFLALVPFPVLKSRFGLVLGEHFRKLHGIDDSNDLLGGNVMGSETLAFREPHLSWLSVQVFTAKNVAENLIENKTATEMVRTFVAVVERLRQKIRNAGKKDFAGRNEDSVSLSSMYFDREAEILTGHLAQATMYFGLLLRYVVRALGSEGPHCLFMANTQDFADAVCEYIASYFYANPQLREQLTHIVYENTTFVELFTVTDDLHRCLGKIGENCRRLHRVSPPPASNSSACQMTAHCPSCDAGNGDSEAEIRFSEQRLAVCDKLLSLAYRKVNHPPVANVVSFHLDLYRVFINLFSVEDFLNINALVYSANDARARDVKTTMELPEPLFDYCKKVGEICSLPRMTEMVENLTHLLGTTFEIQEGLWVRNGLAVLRQVTFYRNAISGYRTDAATLLMALMQVRLFDASPHLFGRPDKGTSPAAVQWWESEQGPSVPLALLMHVTLGPCCQHHSAWTVRDGPMVPKPSEDKHSVKHCSDSTNLPGWFRSVLELAFNDPGQYKHSAADDTMGDLDMLLAAHRRDAEAEERAAAQHLASPGETASPDRISAQVSSQRLTVESDEPSQNNPEPAPSSQVVADILSVGEGQAVSESQVTSGNPVASERGRAMLSLMERPPSSRTDDTRTPLVRMTRFWVTIATLLSVGTRELENLVIHRSCANTPRSRAALDSADCAFRRKQLVMQEVATALASSGRTTFSALEGLLKREARKFVDLDKIVNSLTIKTTSQTTSTYLLQPQAWPLVDLSPLDTTATKITLAYENLTNDRAAAAHIEAVSLLGPSWTQLKTFYMTGSHEALLEEGLPAGLPDAGSASNAEPSYHTHCLLRARGLIATSLCEDGLLYELCLSSHQEFNAAFFRNKSSQTREGDLGRQPASQTSAAATAPSNAETSIVNNASDGMEDGSATEVMADVTSEAKSFPSHEYLRGFGERICFAVYKVVNDLLIPTLEETVSAAAEAASSAGAWGKNGKDDVQGQNPYFRLSIEHSALKKTCEGLFTAIAELANSADGIVDTFLKNSAKNIVDQLTRSFTACGWQSILEAHSAASAETGGAEAGAHAPKDQKSASPEERQQHVLDNISAQQDWILKMLEEDAASEADGGADGDDMKGELGSEGPGDDFGAPGENRLVSEAGETLTGMERAKLRRRGTREKRAQEPTIEVQAGQRLDQQLHSAAVEVCGAKNIRCCVCREVRSEAGGNDLFVIAYKGSSALLRRHQEMLAWTAGDDIPPLFDHPLAYCSGQMATADFPWLVPSFSTCGHTVHLSCIQAHRKQFFDPSSQEAVRTLPVLSLEAGEFLCPLCRTLSNSIVPHFSAQSLLSITQKTRSQPNAGADPKINAETSTEKISIEKSALENIPTMFDWTSPAERLPANSASSEMSKESSSPPVPTPPTPPLSATCDIQFLTVQEWAIRINYTSDQNGGLLQAFLQTRPKNSVTLVEVPKMPRETLSPLKVFTNARPLPEIPASLMDLLTNVVTQLNNMTPTALTADGQRDHEAPAAAAEASETRPGRQGSGGEGAADTARGRASFDAGQPSQAQANDEGATLPRMPDNSDGGIGSGDVGDGNDNNAGAGTASGNASRRGSGPERQPAASHQNQQAGPPAANSASGSRRGSRTNTMGLGQMLARLQGRGLQIPGAPVPMVLTSISGTIVVDDGVQTRRGPTVALRLLPSGAGPQAVPGSRSGATAALAAATVQIQANAVGVPGGRADAAARSRSSIVGAPVIEAGDPPVAAATVEGEGREHAANTSLAAQSSTETGLQDSSGNNSSPERSTSLPHSAENGVGAMERSGKRSLMNESAMVNEGNVVDRSREPSSGSGESSGSDSSDHNTDENKTGESAGSNENSGDDDDSNDSDGSDDDDDSEDDDDGEEEGGESAEELNGLGAADTEDDLFAGETDDETQPQAAGGIHDIVQEIGGLAADGAEANFTWIMQMGDSVREHPSITEANITEVDTQGISAASAMYIAAWVSSLVVQYHQPRAAPQSPPFALSSGSTPDEESESKEAERERNLDNFHYLANMPPLQGRRQSAPAQGTQEEATQASSSDPTSTGRRSFLRAWKDGPIADAKEDDASKQSEPGSQFGKVKSTLYDLPPLKGRIGGINTLFPLFYTLYLELLQVSRNAPLLVLQLDNSDTADPIYALLFRLAVVFFPESSVVVHRTQSESESPALENSAPAEFFPESSLEARSGLITESVGQASTTFMADSLAQQEGKAGDRIPESFELKQPHLPSCSAYWRQEPSVDRGETDKGSEKTLTYPRSLGSFKSIWHVDHKFLFLQECLAVVRALNGEALTQEKMERVKINLKWRVITHAKMQMLATLHQLVLQQLKRQVAHVRSTASAYGTVFSRYKLYRDFLHIFVGSDNAQNLLSRSSQPNAYILNLLARLEWFGWRAQHCRENARTKRLDAMIATYLARFKLALEKLELNRPNCAANFSWLQRDLISIVREGKYPLQSISAVQQTPLAGSGSDKDSSPDGSLTDDSNDDASSNGSCSDGSDEDPDSSGSLREDSGELDDEKLGEPAAPRTQPRLELSQPLRLGEEAATDVEAADQCEEDGNRNAAADADADADGLSNECGTPESESCELMDLTFPGEPDCYVADLARFHKSTGVDRFSRMVLAAELQENTPGLTNASGKRFKAKTRSPRIVRGDSEGAQEQNAVGAPSELPAAEEETPQRGHGIEEEASDLQQGLATPSATEPTSSGASVMSFKSVQDEERFAFEEGLGKEPDEEKSDIERLIGDKMEDFEMPLKFLEYIAQTLGHSPALYDICDFFSDVGSDSEFLDYTVGILEGIMRQVNSGTEKSQDERKAANLIREALLSDNLLSLSTCEGHLAMWWPVICKSCADFLQFAAVTLSSIFKFSQVDANRFAFATECAEQQAQQLWAIFSTDGNGTPPKCYSDRSRSSPSDPVSNPIRLCRSESTLSMMHEITTHESGSKIKEEGISPWTFPALSSSHDLSDTIALYWEQPLGNSEPFKRSPMAPEPCQKAPRHPRLSLTTTHGLWMREDTALPLTFLAPRPRPASFAEALGLPRHLPSSFYQLVKRQFERLCPQCGTHTRLHALCFHCGGQTCLKAPQRQPTFRQSMWSKSWLARVPAFGETTHHCQTCTGGNGLFFLPFVGQLLLVGGQHNNLISSPYLDENGEEDSGLDKGKETTLSKNSLDSAYRILLSNGARKEIIRVCDTHGRYIRNAL